MTPADAPDPAAAETGGGTDPAIRSERTRVAPGAAPAEPEEDADESTAARRGGPADRVADAPAADGGDGGGGGGGESQPESEGEDEGPGEAVTSARERRVRSAVEWVAVLAGAVIVALVVRTFLFTTFWIPSGSMEPTLMGSSRQDRVIVNRLSYKVGDVKRGDIIVFDVPDGEATIVVEGQPVKDLIKRVVGLPGETVSLRDGQVYVDGAALDEPYLPSGTRTEPCTEATEFTIPDDSVFVMGDNRSNSRDARCWSTHWVEESNIVGRAFVRIWPLSEITGL